MDVEGRNLPGSWQSNQDGENKIEDQVDASSETQNSSGSRPQIHK